MTKTDQDWQKQLTPDQYQVLRKKATEPPFSGKYVINDQAGSYSCAACGAVLFTTDDQYESTIPGLIGWPSFAEVAQRGAVELVPDTSFGMRRTEVLCKQCQGHLGHLFEDDTSPTGQHYCINSVALTFKKEP